MSTAAQDSAASPFVLDGVAMIGFVITTGRSGDRIDASSCWISYLDGRYTMGSMEPEVLDFQGQFLAAARGWLDRDTPFATVTVGGVTFIAKRDGAESITVTLEPTERPRHTFESLHLAGSSVSAVLGAPTFISNGGLILVGDTVGGAGRALYEAMLAQMIADKASDITVVRDRPGPAIAGVRGADTESTALPISTAVRRAVLSPKGMPPLFFVESELTSDLAGRVVAASSAGIGVVVLVPGRGVEQVIGYFSGLLSGAGHDESAIVADHLRVAVAPSWTHIADNRTLHCPILLSKDHESCYARAVRRGYWSDAKAVIDTSIQVITYGKGVSALQATNVHALVRAFEKRMGTSFAGFGRGF